MIRVKPLPLATATETLLIEIVVPKDLPKEEVEKLVLADQAVVRALDGAAPKKIIVVPGRIVNLVI